MKSFAPRLMRPTPGFPAIGLTPATAGSGSAGIGNCAPARTPPGFPDTGTQTRMDAAGSGLPVTGNRNAQRGVERKPALDNPHLHCIDNLLPDENGADDHDGGAFVQAFLF